jgi:hypothetical protein
MPIRNLNFLSKLPADGADDLAQVVAGVELTSDGAWVDSINDNVNNAFSRQCERDTIGAEHILLNAIGAELSRLEEVEPELTQVERICLAKRLIKQRLNIFKGCLDQVL